MGTILPSAAFWTSHGHGVTGTVCVRPRTYRATSPPATSLLVLFLWTATQIPCTRGDIGAGVDANPRRKVVRRWDNVKTTTTAQTAATTTAATAAPATTIPHQQ